MKKNLMSVLILALILANLILTAIIMISIVPQTRKANELITKVCAAIDLDLESAKKDGEINVPMEQIEEVKIANGEPMTINLKSTGTKEHVAVMSVSLAVDTKNEDYKSAETISAKEGLIKDEIIKIVSSHTIEEVKEDTTGVQKEILKSLRKMFGSDFIVSVAFSNFTYQ